MLPSPRACLPILLFFSRRCTLAPFPSLLPLPDGGETCVPRPRGRGSPQLDFLHFAYFLLHSLPLHLRVSAVARILPSDLSSRATAAALRSHFFFPARRIFATHESGFLSDPYSHSRSPSMHQSVVPPGRPVSSITIMSQVISACISPPSSFPLVLSPNIFPHSGSPRDNSLHIAYSRIISHVIPRVSSSDTLSLLSPLLSRL